MATRIAENLADILREDEKHGNFHLRLGDFLDEFYRSTNKTRQEMLDIAPAAYNGKPENLAFAAATAHKLANDYNLVTPEWVWEERCYLPGNRPFFWVPCEREAPVVIYVHIPDRI